MSETREHKDRIRVDKEDKLQRLREGGVEPYPWKFERSNTSAECLASQDEWIESEKEITLSGRLMSKRVMGKTSFGHVQDQSGRIQFFFRKDAMDEEHYRRFAKLVEAGDHIGARGVLFLTRSGELSLRVREWTLLSKSMLPLPEKFHGLTDEETRSRQRYLDLAVNPEVRKRFETRSRILHYLRDFFVRKSFLEVETPVLQALYGGATARPFRTRHEALDMDFFLRIAGGELFLKRLLVGGMERVFEIGKVFRNEGMDRSHNPEFTMLEAYSAYWDYQDMMGLVEELYSGLAMEFHGDMKIPFDGQVIDLSPPWPRISYHEAVRKYSGRDLETASREELSSAAEDLGIEVEDSWGAGKILDAICAEKVEPQLIQPTFLTDHPREISPLAKQHRDNPDLVERFEPFIAGFEVGNAFSELNDPAEQRKRFEDQMGLRAKGDEEAQILDDDYLRALEVGMPPAAGLGIGVDRLVMLMTDTRHIRDILLFPHMRPEA
ncbi:MAG: lysine--tRNA ligase [Candidatus Krumholzibacteria bacterium]|jgi:lysyl-tRNA synthetase class 2|nr:lysine--tRNA ligase [Candidatus Krumholzibacteria bacterium]MDP6796415.1 lysine--tRNA ligase [Candidatus Krumholzibacteria bacterium]